MSDLRNRARGGREPSRGELARVDENKAAILQMEGAFGAALGRHAGIDSGQMIRDAMTLCSLNPGLLSTRKATLLGALMTCSQLALRPIPALGLIYVVPFKGNATAIIGYKGLSQLAHRSDQIAGITRGVIRARDEWHVEHGTDAMIVHRPAFGRPPADPAERAAALDPVGYYSIVRTKHDGSFSRFMETWEMEEHRDRFALQRDRDTGKIKGPWVTDFDAMATKTTLRFALQDAPQSTHFQQAQLLDERVRYDADPERDAFQADTVEASAAEPDDVVVDAEPDPTVDPTFGQEGFRG